MREIKQPAWLAAACLVTVAALAAAVIRLWPQG